MNKKALIVTWDGFQDQEVIYPYYRLQEYGFDVTITGSTDKEEVIGLFGTKFKSVRPQDMGSSEDWDLLVLPGGVKALEKVRQDPNVKLNPNLFQDTTALKTILLTQEVITTDCL